MELKITGKTNTTGTRQNKAGESEDIDFTNYKMETAGGSVKLKIRCEDFDELRAAEGDVFELKASKAQTKLSTDTVVKIGAIVGKAMVREGGKPAIEPKLAESIRKGETVIGKARKRGRPARKG